LAADYYLYTTTSDIIDNTAPAATTAKFKDSPAVNRATYKEIGIWSALLLSSAMQLSSLSDLRVWIGLKNSDNQGTYFDLKAEVRKNGSVIASGETKDIQGVTRNPSLAKEVAVAFGAISNNQFSTSDVLSIRILTKVADSGGHNNAVGLRMYYDAVSRQSRFGATFGPPTSALQVRITSPAPGPIINRSSVVVTGDVNFATGPEIGVLVNGLPALVSNNQYAVKVPVDTSITSLTAVARDSAGNTGSDTVSVTVQSPTAQKLFLTPSPSNGAAPLEVSLRTSFLGPVVNYQWDTNGDGIIDLQVPNSPEVIQQYLAPGIYFPTVFVTDSQGGQFAESAVVLVVSAQELVALIQNKWQSLKDALRNGNVDGALSFIAEESRDRYRGIFNAVSSRLPQVDTILTNIQIGAIRGNEAEFTMLRVSSDGVERSFYVLFVRDNDGIWRLRMF
jgi:hypothetical protein